MLNCVGDALRHVERVQADVEGPVCVSASLKHGRSCWDSDFMVLSVTSVHSWTGGNQL